MYTPPYRHRMHLQQSSNEKPYQRPRFNFVFFRAKTVGAGAFSLDRNSVVRMLPIVSRQRISWGMLLRDLIGACTVQAPKPPYGA